VAVGFDKFNEEKERERLRKLSDRELIRDVARALHLTVQSPKRWQGLRLVLTTFPMVVI
jgi:hypothetical protein